MQTTTFVLRRGERAVMVLTSAAGINSLLELIDEEAAELGVSRERLQHCLLDSIDDDQSPGPLFACSLVWVTCRCPDVGREACRAARAGEVLVYEVTDCQPVGSTWDLWILPDMEAAYEQLPWIGNALDLSIIGHA